MTSKEHLINCHVLLKHFELVFIQLQLVNILCKLIIIWVNYEKKQKGVFFHKTPCIAPIICLCISGILIQDTCMTKIVFSRWYQKNLALPLWSVNYQPLSYFF